MDDRQKDELRRILEPILGAEAAQDAIAAIEHSGADSAQLDEMLRVMGNPTMMQAAISQMQQIVADDGASDWKVAHDIARQTAHTGGDPVVSAADSARINSVFATADLWLDAATDLPPSTGRRRSASRIEWVDATLPAWQSMASPVGEAVGAALERVIPQDLTDEAVDGEHSDSQTPFGVSMPQMLTRMGRLSYAMQVGQGAGTMAKEVFGATDVGVPLLSDGQVLLLPHNIHAFGRDLDIDGDQLLHFLAVRELAHARLFDHVSWLRAHLLGAIEQYARGIDIDLEQMEQAVRSINPTSPGELQNALSGIFDVSRTPGQQSALDRLETALALVEGWVEVVTATAVSPHLPDAYRLREVVRRRRAAGGPAEDTFRRLVGLELRPRRVREAAALWERISAERQIAGRDDLWAQLDLMPTAADLDNPAGFGMPNADPEIDQIDAALAQILQEAEAQGHGTSAPNPPEIGNDSSESEAPEEDRG